jgi:hypothetical protein
MFPETFVIITFPLIKFGAFAAKTVRNPAVEVVPEVPVPVYAAVLAYPLVVNDPEPSRIK